MGNKNSRPEEEGKAGGEGEELRTEGIKKPDKEEEDHWYSTLTRQEVDARFNTFTRAKYHKPELKEVFRGSCPSL